jgi:hypothetical protein
MPSAVLAPFARPLAVVSLLLLATWGVGRPAEECHRSTELETEELLRASERTHGCDGESIERVRRVEEQLQELQAIDETLDVLIKRLEAGACNNPAFRACVEVRDELEQLRTQAKLVLSPKRDVYTRGPVDVTLPPECQRNPLAKSCL